MELWPRRFFTSSSVKPWDRRNVAAECRRSWNRRWGRPAALSARWNERVTVAASIGIRARTAREWLTAAYNVTGDNLMEAIHNQTGYFGINAPSTLNHRYIFEDIPMSLVPLASLGRRFGVSVRGMDSMIRLACIMGFHLFAAIAAGI